MYEYERRRKTDFTTFEENVTGLYLNLKLTPVVVKERMQAILSYNNGNTQFSQKQPAIKYFFFLYRPKRYSFSKEIPVRTKIKIGDKIEFIIKLLQYRISMRNWLLSLQF
jgi:hypothetical protein